MGIAHSDHAAERPGDLHSAIAEAPKVARYAANLARRSRLARTAGNLLKTCMVLVRRWSEGGSTDRREGGGPSWRGKRFTPLAELSARLSWEVAARMTVAPTPPQDLAGGKRRYRRPRPEGRLR